MNIEEKLKAELEKLYNDNNMSAELKQINMILIEKNCALEMAGRKISKPA